MNRNKLKTYAPEARRDFIQAVTARAAHYGLTAKKTEAMTVEGDVAIIAGKPYPKAIGGRRKKLEARINRDGFGQTMEAMAYTWFNRLVAIRYMELHGYLDHGYRVLSHPEGHNLPEIIDHAEHVDLPKLDKEKVVELKLDGRKEEELYRMLLIGQCNALSKAMPFLFESIDDETELLLPDHLLHSDSLVRNLVDEIPDEDWQEVEIIGWLYQFYISEKKNEVIGKVVKSEDIPAATQLFTPNWIVKYLVQNSLGRQWVATYPNSSLKAQMEYYIEPAEQTAEVQTKIAEITPDSLNPEDLTCMDPACGSGHILTEAYDLLKAIYQERGYRAKDIPRLILEKNLYGLEIDDRAAQLAAFALMMKARADDRSIFERGVQPHVLSIQESKGLDAKEIAEALNQPIHKDEQPPSGELFEEIADEKSPLFSKKVMGMKGRISQADVAQLIELFEHGKIFGSLIEVPEALTERLPAIANRIEDVLAHGGMLERPAAAKLSPLLSQAQLLARTYDGVITNPPYCGSRYMNHELSTLGRVQFKAACADMFSMFVQRNLGLVECNGHLGVVCPFVWMFIATYESFRRLLLTQGQFCSMVRLEYNAFEPACVPVSAWTYARGPSYTITDTVFIDLSEFKGIENQAPRTQAAIADRAVPYCHAANCNEFLTIPGASFAYSVSSNFLKTFQLPTRLEHLVKFTGSQNVTGRNSQYVRNWWEVDASQIGRERRWVPYSKGGGNRKWWGLLDDVVDWSPQARQFYGDNKTSNLLDESLWFRPGVTYSMLTSNQATFRLLPEGAVYDKGGPTFHPTKNDDTDFLLGLCNSVFADRVFRVLNPTMNLQVQDVKNLPIGDFDREFLAKMTRRCVELAQQDWDTSETSYDFESLAFCGQHATVEQDLVEFEDVRLSRLSEMKQLEEKANTVVIRVYGLEGELSPDLPEDRIVLSRPDREEDIKRLFSFAVGCMMGRYSLDAPGLIYAHRGGDGFDPLDYRRFPADEDGVIPATEFHWFDEDAATRFERFVAIAWPKEQLDENLKFVAGSLGQKRNESSSEAIRRYLASHFYKHHIWLYQKRPVYWLFCSGKHRGFQALVYLHRYNEGTLARMRTEYVIPLLGKMTSRINHLTDDIAAAASSQHRKRLEKEKDVVVKQMAEVQAFDEKLRHYADQRISLDLHDGVKANYKKLRDLLAEQKTVCGK